MAEPIQRSAGGAASPGILHHLSGLLAANLGYLRARLRLAGLEGKEAAIHGGIILGLAIGGLIAVIFGYFLLVIGVVFLIGLAFDSDSAWVWVLLGAALVHFLGAVALVFIAKSRLSAPLFPLTLEELHKDQQWLKTQTAKAT